VRGVGDLWVVELLLRYDGGPWKHGVDRGDKVSRESAYSAGPHQEAVRTSGPSALRATVCSKWAAREPSAVATAQPSGRIR
jgi:hypothetical protein